MRRIALEPAAHAAAQGIGGEHQGDERGQERRHLPVLEEPHGEVDLLPDSARAHEAQHRRGAHVALECVERVRDHRGRRLRPDRRCKRLQPRSAGRVQREHRSGRDGLEQIGVDARQHAGGADAEREGARERPQPEAHHEEQRPDQIRNCAEEAGHCGCEKAQRRRRAATLTGDERAPAPQTGRGEKAQGQTAGDRQHRARDRDRERAQHDRSGGKSPRANALAACRSKAACRPPPHQHRARPPQTAAARAARFMRPQSRERRARRWPPAGPVRSADRRRCGPRAARSRAGSAPAPAPRRAGRR